MSQDVERDSMPGDAEIVRAYNALPKTSPLLRYFVQAIAFNRIPYMENKAELDEPMDLPAAFTQQVMTLALNRAAAPDIILCRITSKTLASTMSMTTEKKRRPAVQHIMRSNFLRDSDAKPTASIAKVNPTSLSDR